MELADFTQIDAIDTKVLVALLAGRFFRVVAGASIAGGTFSFSSQSATNATDTLHFFDPRVFA
jgi:hypothetical protein